MYGLWSMRWFGCFVLLPATVVLVWIAWHYRRELPARWIVEGALAGIIAAVAYDLYRLPFVLNGAPLFQVFPKFGQLLLGTTEPRWLVHTLGWSYHFPTARRWASCFYRSWLGPRPAGCFGARLRGRWSLSFYYCSPRTRHFLGLRGTECFSN
jgi:hypothetical protein